VSTRNYSGRSLFSNYIVEG